MAEVPPLPQTKLEEFAKEIELRHGACYEVAFTAVVKKSLAEFYVIGSVINSTDNKETPHAWLKLLDGSYADPLLQSRGLLATTNYFAFFELNCKELLDCMRKHYGEERFNNFMDGVLHLHPPEARFDKIVFPPED